MAPHAAVGVDDDLAPREAGVTHGAAHDEAAGGVHVDHGIAPGDPLGVHNRGDDLRHEVLADAVHGLDLGGVLGGDDDGLDGDGAVVLVADGHLRLAVRAKIRQGPVVADGGQALREAARQVMRHGHERRGLPRGVAEHHALVPRPDQVERVGGAVLGVEALVHAGGDVGALLMDHVDDAAGLGIETELGARVPDALDHAARDLLDVDVGLGADLAGDDHRTGGDEGLARAADVVQARRDALVVDVPLGLELGLLGEDGVEDRVGDLVGDLIRMALRHGLGGEHVAAGSLGGTKLVWHDAPFDDDARRPLPFRRGCKGRLYTRRDAGGREPAHPRITTDGSARAHAARGNPGPRAP